MSPANAPPRPGQVAGAQGGDADAIGRIPKIRRVFDRMAAFWVVSGGMAIILAIFGILVFIVAEVMPLAQEAEVEVTSSFSWATAVPGAVVCDEYKTLVASLDRDATLRLRELQGGKVVTSRSLFAPPSGSDDEGASALPAAELVDIASSDDGRLLAASTNDGRVIAVPVIWELSYGADVKRIVQGRFGAPIEFTVEPEGGSVRRFAVAALENEDDPPVVAAVHLDDGSLVVMRRTVTENMLTGEVESSIERETAALEGMLSGLELTGSGSLLFGVFEDGDIFRAELAGGEGISTRKIPRPDSAAVTGLGLLLGDQTLLVGTETGGVSIWTEFRQEDASLKIVKIREFQGPNSPVVNIVASSRNRTFAAVHASGAMRLYYSTSERLLWEGEVPVDEPIALSYAPKGDGMFVAGTSGGALLSIDNPHPEASLAGFFRRIWYESYPEPEFAWETTGGDDKYEPKYSLMPVMFGTLKGTVYSLLLAIPLGILGALYTSQFMSTRLQKVVKPTVEVMAAFPTVILGFLAGLWLAPKMEQFFPVLFLIGVFLPVAMIVGGKIWEQLTHRYRLYSLPDGVDILFFGVVIVTTVGFCLLMGGPFESLVFGGDYRIWLYEVTGLQYDQRNAIVVGLAMGFAVIPIVFTISEEAFSSVPRNLIAGSLALGASRWQTVARVVLPAASPGAFAGIMVGFGRAVGETMIVMMAAGNTPIMDGSPFNGFLTLSANIATELPEAPDGGTLYRTLIMCALILFIVTFLVNTVAEVIRLRLRRRFVQL